MASCPRPSAWTTRGVSLVACWWWDCSSTSLLKPVNFPKSNFQLGLDFPIHQKTLPIAQNSSNNLVNYYGGNWKIQKSPNCQNLSQFTKKSPNFQSPGQSSISKSKKFPTGKVLCQIEIKFHLCKNWSIS
jgi:hypothetical protein